jgi:methylthioribose-1-phosphate isomerase
VYEGPAPLGVSAPRFDETPADLVTGGIITDRGVLGPDDVAALTDDLAALRDWT